MTHKEFYYWLDGFIGSRDWTTVKQIDIELIQSKMKEVKDESIISNNLLTEIPLPKAPIFKTKENE